MFEIMDYGKLWAVRLWEGMRPFMGGCDTLRAFSGPGHPPVNLLGTVSLRQTTLELWPVAGAVPSLTSEITIPSFIVVLRLFAHFPILYDFKWPLQTSWKEYVSACMQISSMSM